LRDAGPSGAFLLITPLPTIAALMVLPAASLLTWGLLPNNLLLQPVMLVSVALSVALFFVSAQEPTGGQSSALMSRVREWTDCDGVMGRYEFQKRALAAAGLVALIDVYPVASKTVGVGIPVGAYLALAPLVRTILMVIVVSASARRLHGIGRSCLLAALFPFGFAHLIGFAQNLEVVKLIASTNLLSFNFILLLPLIKAIWGILSIPTFCYLLFARSDESDPSPFWLAPTALAILLAAGMSPYLVPMMRAATTNSSRLEITGYSMLPSFRKGENIWYKPYRNGEHIAIGDVVIIEDRANSEKRALRVVGLAGDRVQMSAGRVILNGALLPQEPAKDGAGRYAALASAVGITRFKETLPSGVAYLTQGQSTPADDKIIHDVPEGRVFLLNDNRNWSGRFDSRTPEERRGLGFVPERDVLGHVIEQK
jgi:signal peptidase I